MEQFLSGIRLKVLVLRIVLGVLFAFLLTRFFFPKTGLLTTLALAGLLTFGAYVMEYLHSSRRP